MPLPGAASLVCFLCPVFSCNFPARVALIRFVPVGLRQREPWLTLLPFVLLFAAFATQIEPVVQNGDAALYNEQIEAHELGVRTIHVGYMLLGSVFHALLPVEIDRAMNLMALFFGVLGAFACYASARLWASRWAGAASVLLLLCSATYVHGMLLSEVDILSASLVTVAYALYVHKRPALAGVAFAWAMLCTPISATLLPLFVFTFALDPRGARSTLREQFRRVLVFGLVALLVYLPIVGWHWHDYLFGGRSISEAPRARFDARVQLLRGASFFSEELWGFGALAVLGLVSALAHRKQWQMDQPALGIVLSALATALFADRAGDVPAHLPLLPQLALVTAVALQRLAPISRRAIWLVPVAAAAWMTPSAIVGARREIASQSWLRGIFREMRAQSAPLPAMLVEPGGFTPQILFEHYAYGRSYTQLAPTMRQFRRRLSSVRADPTQYVIFFRRSIPRDVVRALEPRYVEARRTVNGKRFRVLAPSQ